MKVMKAFGFYFLFFFVFCSFLELKISVRDFYTTSSCHLINSLLRVYVSPSNMLMKRSKEGNEAYITTYLFWGFQIVAPFNAHTLSLMFTAHESHRCFHSNLQSIYGRFLFNTERFRCRIPHGFFNWFLSFVYRTPNRIQDV